MSATEIEQRGFRISHGIRATGAVDGWFEEHGWSGTRYWMVHGPASKTLRAVFAVKQTPSRLHPTEKQISHNIERADRDGWEIASFTEPVLMPLYERYAWLSDPVGGDGTVGLSNGLRVNLAYVRHVEVVAPAGAWQYVDLESASGDEGMFVLADENEPVAIVMACRRHGSGHA